MKFIKYKQVARITLYGFDDLYNGNASSVYTEPLNSLLFRNNVDGANVQTGNNAKRMRFQIKGLDNVKLSEHARFCIESINVPILYDQNDEVKSLGHDDRCAIPRNYPPVSPQGSPHGFSPKMNIYTNLSEKNIYFKILQKKIYILKFQKKITKIINNLYFIICKGGY
jgi:hypothetical protein